MDESRISELRTLHRELAEYLEHQHDAMTALRKTVGVIQQTLDSDSSPQGERSALANRYREYLASLAPTAPPRPNLTEVLSQATLKSLIEKLKEW